MYGWIMRCFAWAGMAGSHAWVLERPMRCLTLFFNNILYIFIEKCMIRECFEMRVSSTQACQRFSLQNGAMAKENVICRCNHQRRRRPAMTLRTASLCSLLLVLLACPIVRPMTEEHRLLERKRRGWVSARFSD